MTKTTTKRESRSREYLEMRECNAESVHTILRTECGCGKNCLNRIRAKLDDPFTAVHELRVERFQMSQKNESKWWFEKLLNCKHEDGCGKMGFDFTFHGLHVCRYTFYQIHGFRGDRRRTSSRSKEFEAMINAGYSHAPIKSHSGPVSLKGDVAQHWI